MGPHLGLNSPEAGRRSRLVWEVPYYPAYYFPLEDVRAELLVPTATVTHSPSRGDARHLTIKAGHRSAEDAALRSVDSPILTTLPESQKVAGLVAFYNEEVDLVVDDRLQDGR